MYKNRVFEFLQPRLPVTAEQQEWVDASFVRLARLLGSHRLIAAKVLRPIPEDFPDTYEESVDGLKSILNRVALAMQLNPNEIAVSLYTSGADALRALVPYYSGKSSGPAGLYHPGTEETSRISINQSQLKEPMSLVATIAHELGHVLLLKPGLIDMKEHDMEPLTDVLTVFLGLGVFTANSAFRFKQFTGTYSQGWSTHRQGYLSEEMFGYALARFAMERGEVNPSWTSFLTINIAAYYKRSARWLASQGKGRILSQDTSCE